MICTLYEAVCLLQEKSLMDRTNIVYGRHAPEKKELAKKMRREMTPAEDKLWQSLRANRLGGLQFRRQQVIDGFLADFYCHAAGLVIEVDGPIHQQHADYDEYRDRILAARDFAILRFTNERIFTDIDAVLAEILTIAQQRLTN